MRKKCTQSHLYDATTYLQGLASVSVEQWKTWNKHKDEWFKQCESSIEWYSYKYAKMSGKSMDELRGVAYEIFCAACMQYDVNKGASINTHVSRQLMRMIDIVRAPYRKNYVHLVTETEYTTMGEHTNSILDIPTEYESMNNPMELAPSDSKELFKRLLGDGASYEEYRKMTKSELIKKYAAGLKDPERAFDGLKATYIAHKKGQDKPIATLKHKEQLCTSE